MLAHFTAFRFEHSLLKERDEVFCVPSYPVSDF
jgi:hypothetical protein